MVKLPHYFCLILIPGALFTFALPGNSQATAASPKTRCGWFANPTPGNAWLTDKDDEWMIGVQGGYQAEGDWPDFPESHWVKTNGNYGYGCACLRVIDDPANDRITRILSAKAKPLHACRKDRF